MGGGILIKCFSRPIVAGRLSRIGHNPAHASHSSTRLWPALGLMKKSISPIPFLLITPHPTTTHLTTHSVLCHSSRVCVADCGTRPGRAKGRRWVTLRWRLVCREERVGISKSDAIYRTTQQLVARHRLVGPCRDLIERKSLL